MQAATAPWVRISIPMPQRCVERATHSRQEKCRSAWLPISTDGWQDIGLALRKSPQSCLSRFFVRERDVDI